MNKKDFTKMALIMALSTSLLALNPRDIYAQDENVSNEKEESQKGNMTEAEAKADYENAKSQLETSEKNYQDRKEDKQNNEKAIEKLEDEIKDKNDKIESSNEKMQASLTKQKDEEEEKIKLGEEEKEKLEKDFQAKDKEIAQNGEKIETTKTQKEKAEKDLEDEKANNPTYLEEFNKAEEEVNLAKEKEAQAKKNLDDKKDLLEAKEKAIDEKESARKKERDKLNEKEAQIKGLDKELADNNKLLQEKKEDLKGLDPESDAYKKLSEEIKDLEAKTKLNEDEIKKLNDQKAQLEEKINQQKDELNKLDEANKDSKTIKTLEGKKEEKNQEKTSLEGANKTLDEELASLNKDIEDQEKEKNNKQKELDRLKAEKSQKDTEINDIKKDISTKESILKEKEAKLAELRAKNDVEKIKSDAQKQWDKGSVGFFEENGSQDALDVFTKNLHKANSNEYIEANKEMTPDDSRSLERMKESIDAIVEVNNIRQEKGGIDGRKLSIVGISDFEMAVAQANANYSQGSRGHASQYKPPYENLSWATNNTARKALEGWYREKELFDELRQMGKKSRYEMDEALSDKEVINKLKSKERMVGHYTNLVDDLVWPKDFTHYDSKVAGYAIRPSDRFKDNSDPAQVHSLVLNSRVGQENHSKIYSVEEYRKKFNDYCEKLKNKINLKVSITDEDKKAIESLEKEVQTLKTDLGNLKDNLASKEKDLKAKEDAIKAREADLSTLDQAIGQNKDKIKEDKLKKEENTKKIDELVGAIEAIEKEIENISSSNSDYNSKREEIEKDIKENERTLEEKNKSLADLKESQSSLEKDLEDKKADLRAEDEKRAKLNEETEALEASIKEKTESLSKAKEDKKGLEENIKQIEDEKKALEEEKTGLASDLEKATEDLVKISEEKNAKEESLAKVKEIKDKITNLEKEIEKEGQTLTDLENSNKALEEAKKLIDKEEKALDKEISEAKAKLESLKKIDLADEKSFKGNLELSDLYKKKQNLEEEVKDDQKRLEQLVAKGEELKAKLEEAKKVYEKDLESYNKAKEKLDEFRKNERDFSSIILPEPKDKISDEKYEELVDALFEIKMDYLFNDIKKDEGKLYENVISYERKDDKFIEKIFDGLEYYNRESIGKILIKADDYELSFIEAVFNNKLNSNKNLRLSIFDDDKYLDDLFKDFFTTNIKGVEVVLSKDKRSYLRADFMINGKYYSLEGRNLSSEEFVNITYKIIENIKSKKKDESELSLRKLAIARDELSVNKKVIEKLLNEYPNIVKNSADKLRAYLAKARKVIEKANFILMEK